MQCANCGAENAARVKFCSECGTPMGVLCPDCGQRNAREAKECAGCGRVLQAAQAPAAERRHLTVFFADIAGSTALSEKLDPEDLRELYAKYQAVCTQAVQRYEGHLAQFLGDGILAYFGYPAAHEDDAARAVRAGLDILAGIAGRGTGDSRLQVRIGIHTGLVVVGDIGAGVRREQLALGEAPNIAARLQAEAQPEGVVISEATRELLAGQFLLEDLGSRTLKGLSRPLNVFRVLGRNRAASRFHAMTSAHGLTKFVGRCREMDTLRAAWEEASSGHGRTVLLRGRAGIGKSRLLAAVEEMAAGPGVEVFEAQCSPYQMNSPLFPILEMIERRLGIEEGMAAANKLDLLEQFAAGRSVPLDEAATALAGMFSIPTQGRYPEIEMPPAKRLQWMIGVVAELLLHSVECVPVVLLVEDLHWADPSTLDLLGEIVERQGEVPMLMVCTTRPEFSAPWLSHERCTEVRVEALPAEDTRALVARVAGSKPLPLALQEELVSRTAGIPLFIEAVTRTILDAGILRELEDRYELTGPVPPGLIPATVQDSLMGRIDRLGADRVVAQLAATIGRESSFELLQAVLGKSPDSLAAALIRLVELEIVLENGVPPSSTYTFRHALIQDAAYESLLRTTRQEFHGKIAEALVTRLPEMAETKPELLARHYEGAGRTADAIAGWMKAGQQAQKQSALRECAAYLQKAIALLETMPEDDPKRLQSEMEAQLALATALMATIGWGARETETACIRARDLCQKLGNGNGYVGALWGLWTVYFLRGALAPSLQAAKLVLDAALASGDPGLEIAARQGMGYSTYFMGDFPGAREHAEKALAYYNPELERGLATVFQLPLSSACGNYLMMSNWFMGYPEQAEKARTRAWATIEALAIPACTVYARACAMMIDYAKRDVATIEQSAELLFREATEGGNLLWVAQARIYRGWAQAMNGHAEAGIAEMKAGLEGYRMTGSNLMTPQFCLMMAEAQQRAGRPGEALAAVSRGLKYADESLEHVHEPELHRLRGEILLNQGASGAGEASLRRAIECAQEQKAKMLELRAAVAYAKMRIGQRRDAEAETILQPLEAWFTEGRETPELREARAILESLAGAGQIAAVRPEN
ncbi:MAG TPA: adenylate/guanylate cyclase domain-containing protein [Terracidiphilus sp.]